MDRNYEVMCEQIEVCGDIMDEEAKEDDDESYESEMSGDHGASFEVVLRR